MAVTAVALAAIPAWTAGCSVLVRLDGLTGGSCGSACSDATADPDAALAQSLADLADAGGGLVFDAGVPPDSPGGGADGGASGSEPPLPVPSADSGAPSPIPFEPADAAPAACTPPTPSTLDVCTGFGALSASPVIDGALDCGVPLWPLPIVIAAGPGTIPSSVQASVAAAWRPDGLYVFVRVSGAGPSRYPAPKGAPAWCGDAIEIYVDDDGLYANAPSYDDPGTIQLVATAPPDATKPSSVGEMFRNTTDLGPWTGRFVSESTSDGFTTEAFITASDLGLATWSLHAGKIGLDLAIDLGASTQQPASCPRLGQFTIQIPQGTSGGCAASCDVGEFCTPRLD